MAKEKSISKKKASKEIKEETASKKPAPKMLKFKAMQTISIALTDPSFKVLHLKEGESYEAMHTPTNKAELEKFASKKVLTFV